MSKTATVVTDAERIADLEYQVSVLSRENSELRSRQMQQAKAESEIEKHHIRVRAEKSVEAVRQLLRSPYSEGNLPTVHRILYRLQNGTAPKDAANWLDLQEAASELAAAKADALATGEAIRDALEKVVVASQRDRQQWIDAASDDLRNLWRIA